MYHTTISDTYPICMKHPELPQSLKRKKYPTSTQATFSLPSTLRNNSSRPLVVCLPQPPHPTPLPKLLHPQSPALPSHPMGSELSHLLYAQMVLLGVRFVYGRVTVHLRMSRFIRTGPQKLGRTVVVEVCLALHPQATTTGSSRLEHLLRTKMQREKLLGRGLRRRWRADNQKRTQGQLDPTRRRTGPGKMIQLLQLLPLEVQSLSRQRARKLPMKERRWLKQSEKRFAKQMSSKFGRKLGKVYFQNN